MATSKVAGLFDMTPSSQIEQNYLNQFLVSPAQMGQQDLYSKIISTMSNAGANIGSSGARLFGGQLPEIIKQEQISKIFGDVQKLGLPKNSQTYGELATRLQAAGYGAEAALAVDKAAEYAKQEQESVRLAGQIEGQDLSNVYNRAVMPYNITKAGADATLAEKTLQDRINLASSEAEKASLQVELDQIKLENATNEQTARQELAMATPNTPEYSAALTRVLHFTNPASLLKEPEKFGNDREAVAREMFKKGYIELSSQQASAVNARLLKNSLKISQASAASLGKDIAAFDTITKDNRESFNAAEDAQTLIIEAAQAKNPNAWEAARTTIARAVGKSKLSNEDIKRLGGTPEIWAAVKDWASKALTGVPTVTQQQQLYAVATIIARAEAERINSYSDRFVAAAQDQGFGGMADVYYPKVTLKRSQGTANKQAPKNIPSWSDWKAGQKEVK